MLGLKIGPSCSVIKTSLYQATCGVSPFGTGLCRPEVAKSLGIGTGTVQRISKERQRAREERSNGPQLTNSLLRRV